MLYRDDVDSVVSCAVQCNTRDAIQLDAVVIHNAIQCDAV